MSSESDKKLVPAYVVYMTFINFIKNLRSNGIPSRIDRSVMSKLSGSGQAALISSLRFLGLIDNDGFPLESLNQLVGASESEFPAILQTVLLKRYAFMSDGTIDLAKASGSQVEQRFRDYGISGSTVTKAMTFFLAAAKDAKVTVSPHVRVPKTSPSNGSRKARKSAEVPREDELDDDREDAEIPEAMPGFVKIPIPLHGMADGVVFLPDGLNAAQWKYALKITKFLLENYRQDDAQGGAE